MMLKELNVKVYVKLSSENIEFSNVAEKKFIEYSGA